MSSVVARVVEAAQARGEPLAQALRHHLLEGLLRRLARSGEAHAFVLRGGLSTRAWIAPELRPTKDLDLVGDFAFDVVDTTERFRRTIDVTGVDDGVYIDATSLMAVGIWLHTAFPGVRLTLACAFGEAIGFEPVTVDVGFGDPLVPEAVWVDYPALCGPPPRVRECRAETQVAWKLHGLAERAHSFRPKDLADLWRITKAVPLSHADLVPAIAAAFESRGFTRTQAQEVLRAPHWTTKTARVRWAGTRGVPPLATALADVLGSLGAPLATLVA